MQKETFYFEKIKFWEITVMVVYIILSIELWFFTKDAKSETQESAIFWFVIATQLLLYHLNYKSLRNLKVYLFWLFIGFTHLCFYILLREKATLIGFENHKILVLRNTSILLLLFQILRYISLKTQNLELVCPGKSKTDIFDQRETTKLDFLLYLIYIAATFLLIIV